MSTHVRGRLILVPVALGLSSPASAFLPADALRLVQSLQHFVVETPKTARAHLKTLQHPTPLQALDMQPLPKSASISQLNALLGPALEGHNIGLVSDAGCPAVADPGARLVERAHALDIRVDPLVGPSSILLALMASGLNGQSFAFHGYLPVPPVERDQTIQRLEKHSARFGQTQIFIETPYRNERLFDALLQTCRPETRLCVARNLTTETEFIRTFTLNDWRKRGKPELDRQPTLFLMLA